MYVISAAFKMKRNISLEKTSFIKICSKHLFLQNITFSFFHNLLSAAELLMTEMNGLVRYKWLHVFHEMESTGYLRSCTLSPSLSSRNLMSSVMSSSSYFCCSRFSSCFSTLHWIMAKAYSWRVSLSADFSRRFCHGEWQREEQMLHINYSIYVWAICLRNQMFNIWKEYTFSHQMNQWMNKWVIKSINRLVEWLKIHQH